MPIGEANNLKVTRKFLVERKNRSAHAGYGIPKYIEFCEILLNDGFTLYLYEARKTVSKYITISFAGKSFKVRFSNHKPNLFREERGDCDFFVGVTNLGVTTTKDALKAVYEHFNENLPKSKFVQPESYVPEGMNPNDLPWKLD